MSLFTAVVIPIQPQVPTLYRILEDNATDVLNRAVFEKNVVSWRAEPIVVNGSTVGILFIIESD